MLVVMADQWPRALLRAALREVGYDAVGASSLAQALRVRPTERDRGPVRLVIADQPAIDSDEQLALLLARHGAPAAILLSRTAAAAPPGPWRRVLQRPVSIADIVAAAQAILPLPAEARHALD